MEKTHHVQSSKRKACLRCAAAKAKCVFAERQKGCERCLRLRRDCVFEDPSRMPKRKNPTKVQKLEEKVDSLLSLLGQRQANIPIPAHVPPTSTYPTSRHVAVPDSARGLPLTPISSTDETLDIVDRGLLTIEQCNVLLHKFKTVKMPQFPFVVVKQDVDAATLRRKSPYLFLTIMTACLDDDLHLQRALGLEVKQVLSRRMIFEQTSDLEFVQGLLLHCCFYHYHFHPTSKQLYMFIQMAVTVIIDLRLDQPPISYSQRVGFDVDMNQINVIGVPDEYKNSRTTDELRAYLGCYYLCSGLSIARKYPMLPHTKWLDQSVSLLEAKNECPTDASLRSLIEMRALGQRVKAVFAYDDPDIEDLPNETLLDMSINTFRQELGQLDPKLPAEDNRPVALSVDRLLVSIHIHEIALYCHTVHGNNPTSPRASHIWTVFTLCHQLLTYFVDLPTPRYKDLPCMTFMPLWYAFVVLSDVICLPSAPGWDDKIIKKEARLHDLGRDIISKVDSLTKTGRYGPDRDIWSFFSTGLSAIQAWFKRREQLCDGVFGPDKAQETRTATKYVRRHVRDVMDSCTLLVALYYRNLVSGKISSSTAPVVSVDADKSTSINSGTLGDEALFGQWDDTIWQGVFEDGFSFFPSENVGELQGIFPVDSSVLPGS